MLCARRRTATPGLRPVDHQPRRWRARRPLALWQAVRQGAVGRRLTFDALIDQFLPGRYEPPAFALKLAHNDVSVANALGRELRMPMRICNLALAAMIEAMVRGWGGRDSRVVMLLQQERAGVEIAVNPELLREALAPAQMLHRDVDVTAGQNSEKAFAEPTDISRSEPGASDNA